MCGIAGVFAFAGGQPPRPTDLWSMIGALRHRGPDGSTTHIDGPVGLAHARLAIIDLAGGAQPIANEDDSVRVILNGEIFNFIELRRELEARGHRFRTHTDTEVLVHLYEEQGDAFVHALNGQFAIALWDARRQRLLLVRDRTGIRPLFFAVVGTRLAFASEVKALFQLSWVPRRLAIDGLASIFSYWSVLAPGTVFDGIGSVPPGHQMVVDRAGHRTVRYWDWHFPEIEPTERSEGECAEELRMLLLDAVRLQLRSDVPVGAYLSGGLDSSIITAVISKYTDTPLRSFSLTFDSPEFDERGFQAELVARLKTTHSSLACTPASIGRAFGRTVWHAESPLVRTAPTPMMLLADHVRDAGYRVVLTGEGADEVFVGYDLFKEAAVRRFIARQPRSAWRGRLLERLYPYLLNSPTSGRALTERFFTQGLEAQHEPSFAHMPRLATTRRVLQFLHPDIREQALAWSPAQALNDQLPDVFRRWLPQGRDQYVEAHTLLSGYLLSSQGDRMAMAASIEARFPFLDHRIIEFANRLPSTYKRRALSEKRILKAAMSGDVPASIVARTKQPYRAPDSSSFFADGQPLDYVRELLSPSCIEAAGLFDAEAVGRLVEKCRRGRAIGFGDNMAFVAIVSTMLVHEQFIAPAAGPQPLLVS